MRRLRGPVPSGIPGRGGGLFSWRRLRGSACGAFFSCLHVQLMLIFYAQAAGILACCHFGLSQGLSLASWGFLVYAQDAWIRLRHFFVMNVYVWGFYFVCRLRGSVPAACWLLPGDALRSLGVVVVVIFWHRLQRSVSANTRS